jgi:hypothetical protein
MITQFRILAQRKYYVKYFLPSVKGLAKLAQTYAQQGEWNQIIAATMNLRS